MVTYADQAIHIFFPFARLKVLLNFMLCSVSVYVLPQPTSLAAQAKVPHVLFASDLFVLGCLSDIHLSPVRTVSSIRLGVAGLTFP